VLRSRPDRFRQVWTDGKASVFENLRSLPRPFLVPQANAEVIPAEEAQLARLQELDFDPAHQVIQVILPAPFNPPRATIDGNQTGVSDVVNYIEGLNRVQMTVNAAEPLILILGQAHYPGWRAYVDGQRVELLRADYALAATAVPAGTHEVEFRFVPVSFIVGLAVSAVSLLSGMVGYVGVLEKAGPSRVSGGRV
jgi:hypothetical protein